MRVTDCVQLAARKQMNYENEILRKNVADLELQIKVLQEKYLELKSSQSLEK